MACMACIALRAVPPPGRERPPLVRVQYVRQPAAEGRAACSLCTTPGNQQVGCRPLLQPPLANPSCALSFTINLCSHRKVWSGTPPPAGAETPGQAQRCHDDHPPPPPSPRVLPPSHLHAPAPGTARPPPSPLPPGPSPSHTVTPRLVEGHLSTALRPSTAPAHVQALRPHTPLLIHPRARKRSRPPPRARTRTALCTHRQLPPAARSALPPRARTRVALRLRTHAPAHALCCSAHPCCAQQPTSHPTPHATTHLPPWLHPRPPVNR